MRGNFIVAVLCSFFLLIGSAAYAATVYKVKGGETLQKIARKHRTTVEQLRASNNLRSDALTPGQKLTIAHSEKTASKKLSRKKLKSAPIEVTEDDQDAEFQVYRVLKGDTVEKIAEKFGVDGQDIIDLNAIKKAKLSPGTRLLIPKETEDDASLSEPPVELGSVRPLKCWKNEEEQGFLVKVANSFSGAPYKYGGDSVRGLDCSAFVRKMYGLFDVQLPRTAREQFQSGMKIDKGQLVTGDLVFFRTKRHVNHPTHVGIYIGEGRFIHASSVLKRGVKVDSLSEGYFDRTYTGAVRVKVLDKDSSKLHDSFKSPANS